MSLENRKLTSPAVLGPFLVALLISSGGMAETPAETTSKNDTNQPSVPGLVEIEGNVVTGEDTYGAPKVTEQLSAAQESAENSLRLLQKYQDTKNRQDRNQ